MNQLIISAATEGEVNPLVPNIWEMGVVLVGFAILMFIVVKFVVPMFEKTFAERAEAIGMGQIKLIGRDPARIVDECVRLLSDEEAYRGMQRGSNPFGDGHAAQRIVATLDAWFAGAPCLLPPNQEFRPLAE